MRYEKRLVGEINTILDRLSREKQPMIAKWVTNEILQKHKGGVQDGDDKPFWLFCGYETVRDKVRRTINRRASDSEGSKDDEQYILPGYTHVHEYYLVNRNGEEQAIHIDSMTTQEVKSRAAQYRSMGQACFEHAKELDRYLMARRQTA